MCNCGKKSAPRRFSRGATAGKSVRGGAAAGLNPAQRTALNMKQAISLTESRQMDAQRRRIEKVRREAIRRKLGK